MKWVVGVIIIPIIIGLIVVLLPRILDYFKERNRGQLIKEVMLKDSYPNQNGVTVTGIGKVFRKDRWLAITKKEYKYLKNEYTNKEYLKFRKYKKNGVKND